MKEFDKMSDTDLANYYIDLCAYRDSIALKRQKIIREIIISRFVQKFADAEIEYNCLNCFFYNPQLGSCERVGGCRYE